MSLILVAIYTSELIKCVEEYISAVEGLSFVVDLGWVVTGSDVNQAITILERCATKSMEWASSQGVLLNTTTMKVALFTRRRGHTKHLHPKLTVKIRDRDQVIQFNIQATCWLGFGRDAHMMFKEQHNTSMKKDRPAEARLQTHTKTSGVIAENVMATYMASVHEVASYGSELLCVPTDAGRNLNNLKHLRNQQTRSILMVMPPTSQGALLTDSRLTPAPVIFDSTQ